ncbi:MAG: thiamine diphosphokinase [Bacteroidales bacterium]|nr:thiamine diphosphokinase [Bacteroidales bacterium]
MKSVAIVCNGQFPRTEYPRYLLRSADVVVCCDGALQTLEKRGIVPDVVIGDLDSVCGRALKRFPGRVVRVDDQETNDLTKAFRWVMGQVFGTGPTAGEPAGLPAEGGSIHILAATGYREDHTLGNLALLMEFERQYDLSGQGISLDLVSDYTTALALSDSATLDVGEGRPVSLFTPDPSLQIRSEGLQWPTDGVRFDNWWKATLNRASADRITLALSHPAPVLVILG